MRKVQSSARAFTLIELLVAIGVIGILIGLLLPALGGAQAAAKRTRSLADLRQIGVSFELYLGRFRETHPFQPAGLPYFIGPPDGPAGALYDSNAPWSLSYAWPTLFHSVAPWTEHYRVWSAHNADAGNLAWQTDQGEWVFPVYHYSNSFIGSPETWMDQGEPGARATRQHEVRFPASKVIVFDRFVPHHRSPEPADARGILLGDSSARTSKDADAARPFPNRTGAGQPGIYHNTPGGLNGTDI
jgi:prepilin-type N-terminal cleavage/methylation domain-containing protein